jgi:hypothetical protein
MKPSEAYRQMLDSGEVAEGYRTLELALRFLRQDGGKEPASDAESEQPVGRGAKREGEKPLLSDLPLLGMLERIVVGGNSPEEEIRRFLRSPALILSS